MIVESGDFSFHSITEDNLEMVRQWRNSEFVRTNMIFQDIISEEQQKQWYKRISNINNIYFVAHFKQTPFGVMNYKNINWKKNEAEAGIFVGSKEYIQTQIPSAAAVLLMHFTFFAIGMEKIYSEILKNNQSVIFYNTGLGFSFLREEQNVQWWELQKKIFSEKTMKLLNAAKIISNHQHQWKISLFPDDISKGFAGLIQQRLDLCSTEYQLIEYESVCVFHITCKES